MRYSQSLGVTKHKEITGCEWASFIGPSDATLRALRTAQKDTVNFTEEERRQIRADRERLAASDQNWIDNCNK